MQKICTGVRMVTINRALSWIVFGILKSCWQTPFQVLSNFAKILFEILYVEA